jgi:hypothetical protein
LFGSFGTGLYRGSGFIRTFSPADFHGKLPQIKPIKSAYFFSLDQRELKEIIHGG